MLTWWSAGRLHVGWPVAWLLLVMIVWPVAACGGVGKTAEAVHPRLDTWAKPVPDRTGLPNLYKVTEGLYRGAQPEDEGFDELKSMGIKTVVNLRTFGSDRSECKKSGLDYVKISMQAWNPSDSDVAKFLRVAIDPQRQPIFVHCLHGADRTGMVVAIHRVLIEGWSKEDALKEMTGGGFGFHTEFDNLLEYV